MKKILYLTFYFEPDLCAGSFRNSPLVKELAKQAKGKAEIDVITTLPNRYSTFVADAPEFEERDNYTVMRVAIPYHQSGMKDQVNSFKTYYQQVKKAVRNKKYDLVVASSSRLFTAYLGYTIAKKLQVPLYLDIRDLFYDNMKEILKSGPVKSLALPLIKWIEKKTFGYATHINLNSEGFKSNFAIYKQANYSYFPNGIDDLFIKAAGEMPVRTHEKEVKTIVYAGNIGEGQGLHKILPNVAKELKDRFRFIVIGDGGAKSLLEEAIKKNGLTNVELRNPVKREELIAIYAEADYLFAHLNDYDAFKKVLPSKLFELATFNKPVIAGVGGYAAQFVEENIENAILFEPCNHKQLIDKLNHTPYREISRTSFIERYKRSAISREMAGSILKYV